MKTKFLTLLLAGGLLVLAAWFVKGPNPDSAAHQPEAAGRAPQISEKYNETLQKGLQYLAKNQFKDGHWEGDDGKHPIAMTGLAGLALLMERADPIERTGVEDTDGTTKHRANINKAVDWLIDKSQAKRDGLIFSEHASETSRYMQGHGLATLFLAGACRHERDGARRKTLTDVLTRSVKYTVKAQSTQGGWYNTSKVEGHDFAETSATVIQIQALQAAENAGIPVPDEAINEAKEYLKMALGKYAKGAKAGQDRNRLADTAAVLACRSHAGLRGVMDEKMDDSWKKWSEYCKTEIPVGRNLKFGRDEIIHYYYALAVYNFGHDTWKPYRTAMFDHLQSGQYKDGSWPAGDGIGVGSVYSTAVWCIVFQLERNCHPTTRRIYDTR